MYINLFNNNKIPYLRLVDNASKVNENGEFYKTKKVLLNLGPLSKFDDGLPNYVDRLKQSFKDGTPLIPELLPFVVIDEKSEPESTITLTKYGSQSFYSKLYTNEFLDKLLDTLGLPQFLTRYKSDNDIQWDLLGIFRLLTFGRILNPTSKYATFFQKDDYYLPLTKSTNPFNSYDLLDVLNKQKDKILKLMSDQITKKIGRNPNVIFYDVTNFYFETPYPDPEIEKEGVIVKGIRQKGVSKENKKEPIVQLGLFLDDLGLPVSFEVFPGNTLDQAALRPALKKTIDNMNFKRFILVADRGMNSHKNSLHQIKNGHGYIISKSIKKTKKKERTWITEQEGYTSLNEGFRYKSIIRDRKEQDEAGTVIEFKEKTVVYWSEKFYKREYREHQSYLEFIKRLKENPEGFRVTKAQGLKLKKLLKKEMINKMTGEVIDSRDLLAAIDEEKLEEFTAYMGYYQIVTSELEMDEIEVIDKYHGLSRIEDQFRVMKSTLESRPLFVNTDDHINAHLLICFIALTMMRLIQLKIRTMQGKDLSQCKEWDMGMSADRIQAALNSWRVTEIQEKTYIFTNASEDKEKDLKVIQKAFGIEIRNGWFTSKELKEIKKSIQND